MAPVSSTDPAPIADVTPNPFDKKMSADSRKLEESGPSKKQKTDERFGSTTSSGFNRWGMSSNEIQGAKSNLFLLFCVNLR